MIALLKKYKKSKRYRTVKLFSDWYESGKWCDENINQDFDKYYFQRVSWLRLLFIKLRFFLFLEDIEQIIRDNRLD